MSNAKRKILTRTNIIIGSLLAMLGIGMAACDEPLVKYGIEPVKYGCPQEITDSIDHGIDTTVTVKYGVRLNLEI